MTDDNTSKCKSNGELPESEKGFRAVFDVATVGIVKVSTSNGQIIRANEKYCQITGYTESELRSKCFPELTHPKDRQSDWEIYTRAVRGELPAYWNEKRYIRKDGSVIWVRLNAGIICDDTGRPTHTVAVCEDITRRKLREANIAILADISKDFAHFSAEDEIVQAVGRKLGSYLNISSCFLAKIDEEQGITTIDYYWGAGDKRPVIGVHRHSAFVTGKKFEKAVRTGETIVIHNTQLHPHTKPEGFSAYNIHAYVTTPLNHFGVLKYLFTVTDSISRNWREDEIYLIREIADRMFLFIQRAHAERALRESKERYRMLSEQLQEANRRKDDFLGALSHEIRNPLTSITLGLSLLERTTSDGKKARQAREIMSRQVAQLSRLVDDLLDVTRITRNLIVLRKEQVELISLVQRTGKDYQAMFEAKGVELVTRSEIANLYVEADPSRLSQVVGNLLHNSLKFTGTGGSTRVTLSLDSLNKLAIIRVEDNGIGMSSETIGSLFTPFMQADASLDRSNGGLGLGLALVKGLVKLHGGTVEAYSAGLGKGSVFTVSLPLLDEPVPVKEDELPSAKPQRKYRILVIEDIKDVAEVLKSLLVEEGHDVRVAYDGFQGIAIAKEYRPEILLCDIGLPGMDGHQVARAFCAEFQDTYLISLTGYARTEDLQRAKEVGFHYQLVKPVDLHELRQALDQVVKL